jgi:hypothetical protein
MIFIAEIRTSTGGEADGDEDPSGLEMRESAVGTAVVSS